MICFNLRNTSTLAVLTASAILSTSLLHSQVAAGLGGITGIVVDASGATVPNAEVLIDNERLSIHRKLNTGNSGTFNAPALVPSTGYQVTVNASGFNTLRNPGVAVLVGQDVQIRATLQIETTTATVEVQDATPVIEDKTDVSQNVTQKQIDNLPINGRRVDSFVLLTPTVVPDGTFGLLSFRGISGGNTFMTDGNDTTETFYGENAGRTRIATQISQDAVQEFQVLSSAYSAEYGRATGGGGEHSHPQWHE